MKFRTVGPELIYSGTLVFPEPSAIVSAVEAVTGDQSKAVQGYWILQESFHVSPGSKTVPVGGFPGGNAHI